MVKINNCGEKQWEKTLGGNSADYLLTALLTTDDGYLLGGYSMSSASGDKSESKKGFYDYWIVKITKTGLKQGDKAFGGTAGSIMTSIAATRDGGYLLAGYSNSAASGDKTENSGEIYYDYWIIKIK